MTSSLTSMLLDFVAYDSWTATQLNMRPCFSLEIVISRTEMASQVFVLSSSVVLVWLGADVISCWSGTINQQSHFTGKSSANKE